MLNEIGKIAARIPAEPGWRAVVKKPDGTEVASIPIKNWALVPTVTGGLLEGLCGSVAGFVVGIKPLAPALPEAEEKLYPDGTVLALIPPDETDQAATERLVKVGILCHRQK